MSQRWQVVRRTAFAVFTAYLVVSIAFGIVVLTPDPTVASVRYGAVREQLRESDGYTAEDKAEVREIVAKYRRERNLDEPVFERYVHWLVSVTTLDWGFSYDRGASVITLLAGALPRTLRYVIPAMVFAVVGGLATGLHTATHRDTLTDRLGTSAAHFGFSLPNFWLAEMLVLFVLSGSGWLAGVTEGTATVFRTVVFPVVVLGIGLFAGQMRYARAQSLEYVDTEFIKLVRAKGASKRRVARHLLRNAAIPLLSLFFTDMIGVLVLNIFVIEYVFGIPGLGDLALSAFQRRDLPVIIGVTMVVIFFGIVGNFVQDVAYLVLDPRVE